MGSTSKSYLAVQAWVAGVVGFSLNSAAETYGVMETHQDLLQFAIPGLATAAAYLITLVLALFGLPSLAEAQLSGVIRKRRKYLERRLKDGSLSSEVKVALQKKLDDLALTELSKYDIELQVERSSPKKEQAAE